MNNFPCCGTYCMGNLAFNLSKDHEKNNLSQKSAFWKQNVGKTLFQVSEHQAPMACSENDDEICDVSSSHTLWLMKQQKVPYICSAQLRSLRILHCSLCKQ